MKKDYMTVLGIILLAGMLSSCASNRATPHSPGQLNDQMANASADDSKLSTAIGGKFESKLDAYDRTKLSRALDSGLGKSTTWTNASTGTTFTVTPVRKMKIGDNQFCRAYTIKAERRGNEDMYNGKACLGDDSNWHPV